MPPTLRHQFLPCNGNDHRHRVGDVVWLPRSGQDPLPARVITEGLSLKGAHVGWVGGPEGLAWARLCDLADCDRETLEAAELVAVPWTGTAAGVEVAYTP